MTTPLLTCTTSSRLRWALCDKHLHQFIIHSKRYGVYHPGGIFFHDNPDQVKLLDFRFRQNEKFLYEYDFGDRWQQEIRVEAILPLDDKKFYPVTTGGKRASHRSIVAVLGVNMKLQQNAPVQALKLFSEMFADDSALVADYIEELQALSPWLNLEHFDRRAVNSRLRLYAKGNEEWRESGVEEVASESKFKWSSNRIVERHKSSKSSLNCSEILYTLKRSD